MGMREKLEERIRRKEQEIQEHDTAIREARAYIQAMQDAVKLLPRDEATQRSAEIALRAGSSAYKAMELLSTANRPMHITDILKGIGMPNNKTNRVSLGGTLSRYARNREIFQRSGPNTFELMESGGAEPPDDFGATTTKADENCDADLTELGEKN